MSHVPIKLSSPRHGHAYAAHSGRQGLRRLALPSALLAALLLSGCGRHDEAVSPIPATPPPSATAALPTSPAAAPLAMAMSNPASGLSFSAVELGLAADADHRIRVAVSRFAPADTIHAAVETMGSGEATLLATWSYQDGKVVQQESRSIKATGPRTTEFTLGKPEGLVAGDYTLKISLNGNPVDSKDFSVK